MQDLANNIIASIEAAMKMFPKGMFDIGLYGYTNDAQPFGYQGNLMLLAAGCLLVLLGAGYFTAKRLQAHIDAELVQNKLPIRPLLLAFAGSLMMIIIVGGGMGMVISPAEMFKTISESMQFTSTSFTTSTTSTTVLQNGKPLTVPVASGTSVYHPLHAYMIILIHAAAGVLITPFSIFAGFIVTLFMLTGLDESSSIALLSIIASFTALLAILLWWRLRPFFYGAVLTTVAYGLLLPFIFMIFWVIGVVVMWSLPILYIMFVAFLVGGGAAAARR